MYFVPEWTKISFQCFTTSGSFVSRNELSQTQRGNGGFGSSDEGKKVTTLLEKMQKEKNVFEQAKDAHEINNIVSEYHKTGGVKTPIPYSEKMKQREQ